LESWRLGVVCYLNAKPLIAGLDRDPAVRMVHDVPSRLATLLDDGTVDAALLPVIDLVRHDRKWKVVSDACIGCDGETLTVRVFSRVPAGSIRRLHVDGDSHTSVVLASLLWREQYNRELEIVPYDGRESAGDCEAVLLIGDKVVHHTLIDYHIETDLGSAWKSLTSLPFVFAVWAAPHDLDVSVLAGKLSAARDRGEASAELIAADFGPGLNWPVTLAKRYLTKRLKFRLGPRQRQAITKFFELAGKHGLMEPTEELVFA
jgi:chorismate dehydratase